MFFFIRSTAQYSKGLRGTVSVPLRTVFLFKRSLFGDYFVPHFIDTAMYAMFSSYSARMVEDIWSFVNCQLL